MKQLMTPHNTPTILRGVAAIAWGGSILAETVGQTMERVHRQAAPALGEMSLALEKRRIRPETVRSWARLLKQGSDDLLKLADRMEEKIETRNN